MTVITLLTDFGLRDGYAGVMKGVIWSICPSAQVTDITHAIPPQDILQGALALQRTAGYFPPGTVHVAVVDPGVGTQRRPLAACIAGQYFVGPDNGLFSLVQQDAEAKGAACVFYQLDRPEFWLPKVSNVFHGRDVFAPVGAHIASGVPLERLGTLLHDPVRLNLPRPSREGFTLKGKVITSDYFGNLATNIRRADLGGLRPARVRLCGVEISGLVNTFGDRPAGDLIALIGTEDDLIISVVHGSARSFLNAQVGDAVEVELEAES